MAQPFVDEWPGLPYRCIMQDALVMAARDAVEAASPTPVYLRLAAALAAMLSAPDAPAAPSARGLATALGVNRATANAAYRELARRGLVELRRGRQGPRATRVPAPAHDAVAEPPAGAVDLARYAPDRELLPGGRVFAWLGLGEGEGEAVAQYGNPRGHAPLRRWLQRHLGTFGVQRGEDEIILTSGVQHALDLLLRALAEPGLEVIVEDPTYPGLPPLLATHRVIPVPLRVHLDGIHADDVGRFARAARPRLAILTPTLQNPSGTVLDANGRAALHAGLDRLGVTIVEEFFEPGLVVEGEVPPPLASRDPRVVLVGSFSKALFPGLRVGWLAGPREIVRRVAEVKVATDLSGSTFLEAAAHNLCRTGELEHQLGRLREAARTRTAQVFAALASAPEGVRTSRPRGGFSLLVALPPRTSAVALAARAAAEGVWLLPGPAMSVSGRDDVVRLAFAAVGGARLDSALARFVALLARRPECVPVV